METISLAITGMTCGHCVAGVRRALAAVPGVQVQDVRIGGATVTADGVPAAALVAAVEDAGYQAAITDAAFPEAPGTGEPIHTLRRAAP